MIKSSKIFITGHRGLVGSALWRIFKEAGYTNLLGRTHHELDLTYQRATLEFLKDEKPDYIICAAGKVGGIGANSSFPAEFIYQNIEIASHIVHGAYESGVKRMLYLGSSCIYPKNCPQPMKEEHLLTSSLEPTNEPYAIAKIAGLKMCEAYNRQYGTRFLGVMPTNLYGEGDHYDADNSHVIPAMIFKFHEAKIKKNPEVVLWGTGKARREFLYVDDLAKACLLLLGLPDDAFDSLLNSSLRNPIINVGSGDDVSIQDLAEKVRKVVGYEGRIVWDTSKPDGTMLKALDSSRIQKLGWKVAVNFEEGLKKAYEQFVNNSPIN